MASKSKQEWKDFISSSIDERISEIKSINTQIHSNPELGYKEFKAHEAFVSLLKGLGFDVTPHAYGVETAFSADFGSGGRLVIFNAEYDALPGIGHACGHNLIASGSFAGFLGAVAALKESGRPGRVRLLGTPAEEGGGGKLLLIDAGAYKDVAACLMAHPGAGYLLPEGITGVAAVTMLANIKHRVSFTGFPAHAAIEPWNGINALDALCLSYNAISMLRQQVRPHERFHGVFTKGGAAPNVIPAETSVDYYVRSNTLAAAERLWARIKKCFDAGALATGCTVEYEHINSYADVRSSRVICREFCDVMPSGSVAWDQPADFIAGSTDQGNVTYECPAFHGGYGINTAKGKGNHTAEFTEAAALESSLDQTLDWAKGMAAVAWRVLSDDAFAEEVKKDWEEDMERAKA